MRDGNNEGPDFDRIDREVDKLIDAHALKTHADELRRMFAEFDRLVDSLGPVARKAIRAHVVVTTAADGTRATVRVTSALWRRVVDRAVRFAEDVRREYRRIRRERDFPSARVPSARVEREP